MCSYLLIIFLDSHKQDRSFSIIRKNAISRWLSPTLATEMGALQERITSTNKGSITSVQAVYVPTDDLTDPAPATPLHT